MPGGVSIAENAGRPLMVNRRNTMEEMRNFGISEDIQDLVNGIISGIMSLAVRATNSNRDSNSLGGILQFIPEETADLMGVLHDKQQVTRST